MTIDRFFGRKGGFVYDLVAGRAVPATAGEKALRIHVALGPCDGRLLMICDKQIDAVKIAAPPQARRGDSVACAIEVVDADGAPLDAVVPLRLDVLDPEGRQAEFSGYYGAAGGKLAVRLAIAPNDSPGVWEVRARELASGREAVHYLRVVKE